MGRAKKLSPETRGAPIEIDLAALRKQFRALRAGRGLSQADAAALLRVSQATVSAFEHGRHRAVRAETLLAMRSLVITWRESLRARKTAPEIRTVLSAVSRDDRPVCVWCGMGLPPMTPAVHFCPACGGHQTRACTCGAPCFDAWASYCGRCGRLYEASTPRPGSKTEISEPCGGAAAVRLGASEIPPV